MYQPPPPAPPPPPPPPAPVTGSTPLPAARFVGDPADAQVLAGLRARREMLGEQLERVAGRRGDLANQLANTSFAEAAIRKGYEQRLQVLDEQVVQLERDLVATDRQLASAPPELLAQTVQEAESRRSNGPDEDDLLGFGAGGFGLGILAVLVAGRIRRWRRRRRGVPDAAPGAAPDVAPDPRIDRLSHAVDAIAVEVERIGEGQRFVTQLLAESRARVPELAGAAEGPPTQAVHGARQ